MVVTHFKALSSMNLETEEIHAFQIEECKVYYGLFMRTLINQHQVKHLNFVSHISSSLFVCLNLVYSIVRLRLPEDHLITALVNRTETQLFEMDSKDIALVAWSLGRLNFPKD